MSASASLPRVLARLSAVVVGVVTVGLVALPAANATDTTVRLILGPGQSGSIGTVVSNTSVTPVPTCDPGLSVTFDATMAGTVHVASNAVAATYGCSVDFQFSGQSLGLFELVSVDVPGLSVDNLSVNEGNTGTTPATFTVTMSEPSTATVTVLVTTATGTAASPADYSAVSNTVTFAPGATSETVSVPVAGDTTDEVNETFSVNLSAATGAAVTTGQGIGTIVDDDRNGVFSCRASAIDVGGIEPLVANAPGTPCSDDRTLVQSSLDLGTIHVASLDLLVSTDQTPDSLATTPAAGDGAVAVTDVSAVSMADPTSSVTLDIMGSTATATCVSTPSGLVPSFSGSSSVTNLVVNGSPVGVTTAPIDIQLSFGVLHLNATITTANSITQRAAWLHTAFGDVVVAESGAGIGGTTAHPSGNPCIT